MSPVNKVNPPSIPITPKVRDQNLFISININYKLYILIKY
jgi:hypothetical protein